jgi:hypothetical protein
MDHVISADESVTIEIQKKTMDWTGKLAEFFGRANTEGIHMAIQGLRTKYNGELDQIQPAEAHWTFTSPAAMIGIDLDLFLNQHADFQHPSISGDTSSGTFGSTYADSQPTPDSSRYPGNQQSGHKIKRVYSDSYQHLMKKLPEERERYWNNIQSNISDEF